MTIRDYTKTQDILMHHGIKGMKWGIRRYQNPDGTLTAAGKKRYTDGSGNLTKKGERFVSNHYNYKNSDNYRSTNSKQKRIQEADYAARRGRYGARGANRIEYNVRVKGQKLKDAEHVEEVRRARNAMATIAGSYLAMKGYNAAVKMLAEANVGSQVVDYANKRRGVEVVNKKGINLNPKQFMRYRDLGRAYLDANGYNGEEGVRRASTMVRVFKAHKGLADAYWKTRGTPVKQIGKAIIDM